MSDIIGLPHADLLSTERPTLATWRQLCQRITVSGHAPADLRKIAATLSTWPRELPRPMPPEWKRSGCIETLPEWRKLYASLCNDICEEDTYPLYVVAAAGDLRLQLSAGRPAVTLWRQPRGVVELRNGAKMKLGEEGMGDLGGVLVIELNCLGCIACDEKRTCKQARLLQLYVEVEVKLDGLIPPLAAEYRGTSTRKLTQTEQDQVKRQQAMTRRGGCYIFTERTKEMCNALAAFRDSALQQLR